MSTLDKYRRIKQESEKAEEHEIRITGKGRIGMYIAYAAKLFLEKKQNKCVLKGSGPAIRKVCQTAEILRQRIKGLHQQSKIYSTTITDVYEPLEEGLDKVEQQKSLTVFEVLLTLAENEIDKSSPGYQEPLPESQVIPFKYNYFGPEKQSYQQQQPSQGRYFRGRGGRRGRRPRGGGRGGRFYNNNNRRGGRQRQRMYDDYDDYYERPQRQRRPAPRYEDDDDYYYEQPRRRGQRRYQDEYDDEDYYRQDNRRRQQRYEDDDYYYQQPRRRQQERREPREQRQQRETRQPRKESNTYSRKEQEPKIARRPRGNRRA